MTSSLPTDFAEIARLHRAALDGLKGTLVVTCTQPGEGTSTVASLLAARSAEEEKKTLLVDLNLRHPWLTETTGSTPQPWNLPDLARLDDVLKNVVPLSPHLDLLPAPADRPSIRWLCETTQARFFFDALKNYDHVIVDTTPLTIANRRNVDPALLAAAADRTLFVLLSGITPYPKIKKALQDLQASGAQLVGVAVNDLANPSAKETILNMARLLRKVAPGLGEWLEYRAHRLED
jgi:Mrp family chromosome partitioning ATPase